MGHMRPWRSGRDSNPRLTRFCRPPLFLLSYADYVPGFRRARERGKKITALRGQGWCIRRAVNPVGGGKEGEKPAPDGCACKRDRPDSNRHHFGLCPPEALPFALLSHMSRPAALLAGRLREDCPGEAGIEPAF